MKVENLQSLVSDLKANWNNETISDVKVYVGSEKQLYYVSSFLLAARSTVFLNMFFTSNMTEARTKTWHLSDFAPESFEKFMEYIYTGGTIITSESVFQLMTLSDCYLFPSLQLSCQQFLKTQISFSNALHLLDSASRYQAKKVIKACWIEIKENTEQCLSSPTNLLISEAVLEALLTQDELVCEEIQLFNFLVNWAKQRQTQLDKSSGQENSPTSTSSSPSSPPSWVDIARPFLQHIRLPTMKVTDLTRTVRPLRVVPDSIYMEALQWFEVLGCLAHSG